jgi:hypothetical protein
LFGGIPWSRRRLRCIAALRPHRLALLRFRGLPAYCPTPIHLSPPSSRRPYPTTSSAFVVQHSKRVSLLLVRINRNGNATSACFRSSSKSGAIADMPASTLGANRRPEQVQQTEQVYSITSSALASSAGGTSRPSVLAVLRLITSSYFVGACTGRSAGFSPLRTRST